MENLLNCILCGIKKVTAETKFQGCSLVKPDNVTNLLSFLATFNTTYFRLKKLQIAA